MAQKRSIFTPLARLQRVGTGIKRAAKTVTPAAQAAQQAEANKRAEIAKAQSGPFGYTPTTGLGVYNNAYNTYAASQKAAYENQLKAVAANRDNTINTVNAGAQLQANNAYINMMKAKLNNREVAANRGITGGGRERMDVANMNNYNKGVTNIAAGKTAKIADAHNAYATDEANLQSQHNLALAEKFAELGQANINRNDELAAQKWEREQRKREMDLQTYAETKNRYTSVKAYNKAIKNAKKKGNKILAKYLQQGKAEFVAAEKERNEQRKAAGLKTTSSGKKSTKKSNKKSNKKKK